MRFESWLYLKNGWDVSSIISFLAFFCANNTDLIVLDFNVIWLQIFSQSVRYKNFKPSVSYNLTEKIFYVGAFYFKLPIVWWQTSCMCVCSSKSDFDWIILGLVEVVSVFFSLSLSFTLSGRCCLPPGDDRSRADISCEALYQSGSL